MRGAGDRAGAAPPVGPLLRTLAHLEPAQVGHRARLRLLRRVDHRLPRYRQAPPSPIEGWPREFASLDGRLSHGDAATIAEGRFCFLGEERSVGDPADWDQHGSSRLWRYHLHYFEWAWALARAGDRDSFARLWRSWSSSVGLDHRDAWSPYVASLRAWALCDTFEALAGGSDIEGEVAASLWTHLRFVAAHLELDVGGNHLMKNLKALLGLAMFFGDGPARERAAAMVAVQAGLQVLADGGHYERSPSYHVQVLADLADIAGLCAAAGVGVPAGVAEAVAKMRDWLGAMSGQDGRLPLFNDCVPVDRHLIEQLGPVGDRARLRVLAGSGYVVLQPGGGVRLVLDVGDPCPPTLPAHAHADCLSFELCLDGVALVTDSGTSTYQPGPRRRYERSTGAHSTVEVDGKDQTEVWATFRAGRRAHGRLEQVSDDGTVITVVASHDGYRHLPGAPRHRRTVRVGPDGVEVEDRVEGAGEHRLRSSLYLTEEGRDRLKVTAVPAPATTEAVELGVGFGSLQAGYRLSLCQNRVLPTDMRWELRW